MKYQLSSPSRSPETVSVPRRGCNPFNDKVTCAAGEYAATHCECETCSAGTYSAEGADECTQCYAGTYSGAAASSCTSCPAGTYSAAGAGSCTSCPAGTYSAAGADLCTTCPAGTYSGVGASSCTQCDAGSFSAAGQGDDAFRGAEIDIEAAIEISGSECSVTSDGELLLTGNDGCSLDVPVTWDFEGSLVVEFETRGCREEACTTSVTGGQTNILPHWFFEPFRSSLGSTGREEPDLWWLSDGNGLGDYQWDNSATDRTHYGPPQGYDPTQWHTWRFVFATRNSCVYLDAWAVDGVDVLPSTRSYCSAFGKTTYLGLATWGGTYAYLRRFASGIAGPHEPCTLCPAGRVRTVGKPPRGGRRRRGRDAAPDGGRPENAARIRAAAPAAERFWLRAGAADRWLRAGAAEPARRRAPAPGPLGALPAELVRV